MIARLEKDHLNLVGPSMISGLPPLNPTQQELVIVIGTCRENLRSIGLTMK